MAKYGRWTGKGASAEGRIGRLRSHIDQVEGRMLEEWWAEHTPLLEQQLIQIVDHFPDALEPLEGFDPARRCRKCGGKARATWEADRLKRVCKRCGFTYLELPLDSAPEIEKPPSPDLG